MANIDEKTLAHLCKLARIEEEQNPHTREKLLHDLSKILDYFTELQTVDTSNIEPVAGGNENRNVSRDDNNDRQRDQKYEQELENVKKQFSESENGYMKVPGVFNNE